MNIIKFRQRLLEPTEENFFHYWGYLNGLEGGFTPPENDTHESDRFTGLEYRNGMELYENDIVHRQQWDASYAKKGWSEAYWVVEYGYFGDPHVLYVSNQINSGRVVSTDEIRDRHYKALPSFNISGKEETEMVYLGNKHEDPELFDW